MFDCVNHEFLLGKLNPYGIHELNIKWFESCLTNREQRVYVISHNHQQKFSSNWGAMKCGVPQGSILGLILFVIYINGLPLNMNIDSKLVLFMDDTSILITTKNLRDLQRKSTSILNQINKWFIANGLSINIEKTIAIHFKSNNLKDSPFPISYQDYHYWYSALWPVWAETRVQSVDWCVSGTLHPGQVLRGSLPLLSPAF